MISILGGCARTATFEQTLFRPASNTIIVFIHGFTANNDIWPQETIRVVSDVLNADSYWFSYDSRLIDPASLSQTTDDAANTLAKILESHGAGKKNIVLVGHSQGGIVALRTLIKMPQAPISKVVLLGTPLFGSTSVPPEWVLPTPSQQLVELAEHSQALLDLNLSLKDHLTNRPNPPVIVNVMSRLDEYVPAYSAFVNVGKAVNIVTDVGHNALPNVLSSTDVLEKLQDTSAERPSQHVVEVRGDALTDMPNTLLIKAPELKGLRYFYRATAGFDPPDDDLAARGYSRRAAVGVDPATRAAGYMTWDEAKASSDFRLQLERNFEDAKPTLYARSRNGSTYSKIADGDISRPVADELPSQCDTSTRDHAVIWTRPLHGPQRHTEAARIDDDMLECLSDINIVNYMRSIGYDTVFQKRTIRRSPSGEIVIKEAVPVGNIIARQFFAQYPAKQSTDTAKRLIYFHDDGQLKATSNLTIEEHDELNRLQRHRAAPPPPDYFSRRRDFNDPSLYGFWAGDYLVIRNVKEGTYNIDVAMALAPYWNGREGDGLNPATGQIVERLTSTPHRVTVLQGTSVVRFNPVPSDGAASQAAAAKPSDAAPPSDPNAGGASRRNQHAPRAFDARQPEDVKRRIARLNAVSVTAENSLEPDMSERRAGEAYELALREFGAGDRRTIGLLCNYAVTKLRKGLLTEAERQARQAVSLGADLLGEYDESTWHCARVYAAILEKIGRVDEAEIQYDRAYRLYGKAIKDGTIGGLSFVVEYASFIDRRGKKAEAERCLYDALRVSRYRLGEQHRVTADITMSYAELMEQRGQKDKADSLIRRLISFSVNTSDTRDGNALLTLANIAILLANHGFNDEAESRLRQALEMSENAFGKTHPVAEYIRWNLGRLLEKMGRRTGARHYK